MINAARLPHSLTQCPQCTDRLLALFFYSPIQKMKHAQGCLLVAGQAIAPQTAEHQRPEKKGEAGEGWGEQTSQSETCALG